MKKIETVSTLLKMLETTAWDLIMHYRCKSLSVYPHFCVSDHRDKRGAKSPGFGIPGSCEPLLWVGGNELQSFLDKSSMFTSLLIQLFSPITDYG